MMLGCVCELVCDPMFSSAIQSRFMEASATSIGSLSFLQRDLNLVV
jgi:hypothetical protein